MKKLIVILATLILSFTSFAGSTGNEGKPANQVYQVGQAYNLSGAKYTYLGKDAEGVDQWAGYVNKAGFRAVKKAPRFNSKTRKVSKRRF